MKGRSCPGLGSELLHGIQGHFKDGLYPVNKGCITVSEPSPSLNHEVYLPSVSHL